MKARNIDVDYLHESKNSVIARFDQALGSHLDRIRSLYLAKDDHPRGSAAYQVSKHEIWEETIGVLGDAAYLRYMAPDFKDEWMRMANLPGMETELIFAIRNVFNALGHAVEERFLDRHDPLSGYMVALFNWWRVTDTYDIGTAAVKA